jgi:eukaryotic-like serine/threonine-protein kinase
VVPMPEAAETTPVVPMPAAPSTLEASVPEAVRPAEATPAAPIPVLEAPVPVPEMAGRAEPAADVPSPAAPIAQREADTATAALPLCTPDVVRSRSGNHPGYGRIVFDWQAPMDHRIRPTGAGVEITFPGARCLPDVAGLQLPRNVAGLGADAARQMLLLQTARGNQVVQRRWQGRLILDIQD